MPMRLERETVPQMLDLGITRERTIIIFAAPQASTEAEMALIKEQFELEYEPASVDVLLPKCSSGITLWRVVWEHELTKPPYDFAIRQHPRDAKINFPVL